MLTLKQHLVSGPRRVDAFQEAEFGFNVRAQLTTLLLCRPTVGNIGVKI
jgi:hypothetical protein